MNWNDAPPTRTELNALYAGLCPLGRDWFDEWIVQCAAAGIQPEPVQIQDRLAQAREKLPVEWVARHEAKKREKELARETRRLENLRIAEEIRREQDLVLRREQAAARAASRERDYELRPRTDVHDATWMSNFSLGRDTDHLLALDSWNEHLMRGMEYGYHV